MPYRHIHCLPAVHPSSALPQASCFPPLRCVYRCISTKNGKQSGWQRRGVRIKSYADCTEECSVVWFHFSYCCHFRIFFQSLSLRPSSPEYLSPCSLSLRPDLSIRMWDSFLSYTFLLLDLQESSLHECWSIPFYVSLLQT